MIFKKLVSILAGLAMVAASALVAEVAPAAPMKQHGRNLVLDYSVQLQHNFLEEVSLKGEMLFIDKLKPLPIWFPHGSVAGPPPLTQGISQVGINMGADLTTLTYTNALKGMQATNNNAQNLVDGSGYPIGTLASNIASQVSGLWLNSTYTFSCPVTRPNCSFGLGSTTTPTLVASAFTGGMTLNGSSTPGTFTSSNLVFKGNGSTAGSVTFQCTAQCFGMSMFFPTTGTYAPGSGEWILCRSANNGGPPKDDCSQYALAMSTSGAQGSFLVPEFIAAINSAKFGWLRNMGGSAADSTNISTFGYRQQITDAYFPFTHRIVPSARSGGAGNATPTCLQSTGGVGFAPIIYTCASSDDMNSSANNQGLGAWADGDTIMGNPSVTARGWMIVNAVGDGSTNCNGGPCVLASVAHSQITSGSIAGTTLTVTTFNSYGGGSTSVLLGDTVFSVNRTPVAANTTIIGNSITNPTACTPNCTGNGGAGTYALSTSQNVSGTNLYTMNLAGVIAGNMIHVGELLTGTYEANGIQTISGVSANGYQITLNTPFVHAFAIGSPGYASPMQIVVPTKAGGAGAFILNCEGQSFQDNCGGNNANNLSTGYLTFSYDEIMKGLIMYGGGVNGMVPYEYFVNMANQTNANFWMNLPPAATKAYRSSAASLVFSLLIPPLKVLSEDANESWNSAYAPWRFEMQRENALGINPPGATLDYMSYHSFRAAETSRLFAAVFSGANRSRYEAGLMGQYCCSIPNGALAYGMNGTYLATNGRPAFCAYLGGTYTAGICSVPGQNVYPNRPADNINAIGGAPYSGGDNITNGTDVGGAAFGLVSSFFQAVLNGWINGDKPTALSLIDQDMRGLGGRQVEPVTCNGSTITASSFPTGVGNFVSFVGVGGTLPSGLDSKQIYLSGTPTNAASFTSTGSGNTLTASAVTGTIAIGAPLSGTGVPSVRSGAVPSITPTTIVGNSTTNSGACSPSACTGAGGAGTYATSAPTTSAAAALTTGPWTYPVTGFTKGVQNGSPAACGTVGTGTIRLVQHIYTATPFNQAQAFNGTTQSGHGTWDNLAHSYNTGVAVNPRPAGMGPILVRWYEGDMEIIPYAATQFLASSPPIQIATTSNITGSTHTNSIVDNLSTALGFYTGMTVASSTSDIPSTAVVKYVNYGCPTTCTGNYVILATAAGVAVNATASNANEGITFSDPTATGAANAFNDAVITGWKNDPSFAATWLYYYKGFMGTDPNQASFGQMTNSGSPSALNFMLSQEWGYSSCMSLWCNPMLYPFWQNLNGTYTFNTGGWLLKRDLDPASNDNDPMWLEKAA